MVQPTSEPTVALSTEFVETTPALAAEWLLLNTHNRPTNLPYVHSLALQMERGEFDLNGEAIKFDFHGRLLDGQHRLAAIVECGLTIRLLVIRGLAPNTQDTMDRGKGRSVGDALSLHGVAHANVVAGALNWLYRMESGKMTATTRQISVTPRFAKVLLEQHPGLVDMGAIVEPIRTLRLAPSMAWACAYRFSEIDPLATVEFFTALGSGENLASDSPIYRLRELLISELAKTGNKHKTKPWILCALIIKSWNYWRDGVPIKTLRMRLGGAKPEAFPEPH